VKPTIAVLPLATLLAACADGPHPTAPDPNALEVAAVTSMSSAAPLPSALIPVEDALGRVMQGLPDGRSKDEFHAALQALAAALETNNGCAIRTTRREAEHALRALGRHAPAEVEPDLEIAKLALESVQETSNGRCIG
jgi:hypothetical protein